MVIDVEHWSVNLKCSRPQADTHSALITLETLSTSIVEPELDAILVQYDKLLAKSSTDLGRITTECHHILLKDDVPTSQRLYRQSFLDAQKTSKQIKDLLEKGLIRQSVSPFAAPITLADKNKVRYQTGKYYIDGFMQEISDN